MYSKRFFYVLISFRLSMFQSRLFIKDNNFKLIRFEDLLDDVEGVFQEICRFIGHKYSETILDIPQADSSYTKVGSVNKARGINKELAGKWRKHLHPLVSHLFRILLKREMKYFGYLN